MFVLQGRIPQTRISGTGEGDGVQREPEHVERTGIHARWVILLLVICSIPGIGYSQAHYKGLVDCGPGSSDCNSCINDFVSSLETLEDRGETLGFHRGAGHPLLEGDCHWQGIQRLRIPELKVPYFAVSSNHDCQGNEYARIAVAKFTSRTDEGHRLRSNRLAPNRLTKDAAPPTLDRIVTSYVLQPETFSHPGGMQSIGKYLLVGSDVWFGMDHRSPIYLLDMSRPEAPDRKWVYRVEDGVGANSVAITRLDDGHFLMAVARSVTQVNFYRSRTTSLIDLIDPQSRWRLWDRWSYVELEGADPKTRWLFDCDFKDPGPQNINMFVECTTGDLYLLNSHGPHPADLVGSCSGDWIRGYRLIIPRAAPGRVRVRFVTERHMFPGDNAGERQGHLQAAAGAYVSPDHKLYFYATTHGFHGPDGSVKMIEFSPRYPETRVESMGNAWVRLYEHDSYAGRSIMLDYVDRELRNHDDFDSAERYDNVASSVIYLLPPGYSMFLYEHDRQGGREIELCGTGTVGRMQDLDAVGFDNTASSAEWRRYTSNSSYVGKHGGDCERGTVSAPFKSVRVGVLHTAAGGVINIAGNTSYDESVIIRKELTLRALRGSAVIGR